MAAGVADLPSWLSAYISTHILTAILYCWQRQFSSTTKTSQFRVYPCVAGRKSEQNSGMINREECQTLIPAMKTPVIILTLLPYVRREDIAHLENLTHSPRLDTVKCFVPLLLLPHQERSICNYLIPSRKLADNETPTKCLPCGGVPVSVPPKTFSKLSMSFFQATFPVMPKMPIFEYSPSSKIQPWPTIPSIQAQELWWHR